jgi:hypothetical protein
MTTIKRKQAKIKRNKTSRKMSGGNEPTYTIYVPSTDTERSKIGFYVRPGETLSVPASEVIGVYHRIPMVPHTFTASQIDGPNKKPPKLTYFYKDSTQSPMVPLYFTSETKAKSLARTPEFKTTHGKLGKDYFINTAYNLESARRAGND